MVNREQFEQAVCNVFPDAQFEGEGVDMRADTYAGSIWLRDGVTVEGELTVRLRVKANVLEMVAKLGVTNHILFN